MTEPLATAVLVQFQLAVGTGPVPRTDTESESPAVEVVGDDTPQVAEPDHEAPLPAAEAVALAPALADPEIEPIGL